MEALSASLTDFFFGRGCLLWSSGPQHSVKYEESLHIVNDYRCVKKDA